MDVTVAVVPRERFRPLVGSLKSLFSTIAVDIPVVVVDGGAPGHIRDAVKDIQKSRDFDLIETEGFVLPNAARNLALSKVKTKYVVFCDNDLAYSPDWLTAMVENAEANGSGAVAPTTLIGPTDPALIHHAGGIFWLIQHDDGQLELKDKHLLSNARLQDAIDNNYAETTSETQNFEYHCVLMLTQALRDTGGLDERVIGHEHLDTSLRLMANGYKLTYEPQAHVMYQALVPFTAEDWPYFHFRWAPDRYIKSSEIFRKNWGLRTDNLDIATCFANFHTKRAIGASGIKKPKWLPRRSLLGRSISAFNRWSATRHDQRLPDRPSPHIPPPPPENGLALAGITPTTDG